MSSAGTQTYSLTQKLRKMKKKTYVKPQLNCEEFVPSEYVAACEFNIELICDIMSWGATHDETNNVYKWSEDGWMWHSTSGGCNVWVEADGSGSEAHGGYYIPSSLQSSTDLGALEDGTHNNVVVEWQSKDCQTCNGTYKHKGYIKKSGNHS